MNWNEACLELKQRMFDLARCTWNGNIRYKEGAALLLSMRGDTLTVQAPDLSGIGRGLFMAACALRDGVPCPSLNQTRHIASCGMMLDMSRGGVMKLEAVKGLIDAQAALGLNLMMLYTEDLFEVEGYPYFGYLRGRYTGKELRELDQYAAESGVELVPCIQTLAHLEQFLQWDKNRELKDNDSCLLADHPGVYDFIRAEIEAICQCFRTRRIHIGMDEAHGIGLGRYFELHGAVDRYSILTRHLNKVVALCEEKGLMPIMWSDMFYRLGSEKNDYYDTNAQVPSSVIAEIPNVALCYWDYYHTDETFYANMLKGHQRMGKETVFAGGIWTWSGFLPHVKRTDATVYPALRACLQQGVDTVIATMWGDDGCETDYRLALNQLPIYSEHVWRGEACSKEEIARLGENLTGLSQEAFAAFGAFYPDAEDYRPGKGLFYCDPLYPLAEGLWTLDGYEASLSKGMRALDRYMDDPRCEYAWLLLNIARRKLRWNEALRSAYCTGDREAALRLADRELPALRKLYRRFLRVWREQWEDGRKRNGWETSCARIGSVLARLDDAQMVLQRWGKGETEKIEELEDAPLPARRLYGRQDYHTLSFPQFR